MSWVGFCFGHDGFSRLRYTCLVVGRTVTDARSQLSSSKVEAVELLKWGLDKGLI